MENLELSGASIPKLGLGTYRLQGKAAIQLMTEAISLGYSHLDTAQMYENETEVGKAIKLSGKDRESLWVTTKVWPSALSRSTFLPSVEESLRKLQIDQVDLLLIHWPSQEVPLEESVEGLMKAQEKGYARYMGVSNFPSALVEKTIALGADILTNQVEYHPFLSQNQLKTTLDAHHISLTAYRPIAKGLVNDHADIQEIAAKYGKTGVQVSLRWLIQQERVMAIPMTSKVHRLRENADIFDFVLTEEEMESISKLGVAQKRYVDPAWGPDWDAK